MQELQFGATYDGPSNPPSDARYVLWECETAIARHMVGQALLAAHYVALAEKAGMTPSEINAILKDVSERSAKQKFWITDVKGHAYLTNTGGRFHL
jgi:hypothetical protein